MKKSIIQVIPGLVTVVLLALFQYAEAQPKKSYNVAIFLYEGVELLDFAGPGEVFSASGFNVYTVSADGKELKSQRFLTVKPQYDIANAPVPDVIVFPGGHSSPSSKDERVLGWVKSSVAAGTTAMSVCTGAEILGAAGLLKGLNVTTFHGFIQGLQSMLPDSKVLSDTRFVDNGAIITTAGVSAGIDGALHLVSRIKGLDVAKNTAIYMEYDKWKPEEGRVDYKNESLERLKTAGPSSTKENKPFQSEGVIGSMVPFEGELKNLAMTLRNEGKDMEAQRILEASLKWYPGSVDVYNQLSLVYKKLGKDGPLSGDEFIALVKNGKIDEAAAAYDKAQKTNPGWIIFTEDVVNSMGYHFLQQNETASAVKLFQLNARAYPASANAFDSLGEGLMKAGNKKEAIANYKKSLEIDPQNINAKEMLRKLEGKI